MGDSRLSQLCGFNKASNFVGVLNVMCRILILFILISHVNAGSDKGKDDSKRNDHKGYMSAGSDKVKDDSKNGDRGQKGHSDKIVTTLTLPHCAECESEYDSIIALHRLLDDDHDGSVDQAESDEFIRDELKYTDGFERQTKFHGGDKLISVDDLWRVWENSPVHNWTVEDVVDWLEVHVELDQYSETFKAKGVNGSFLPRVAVNSNHFLSGHLGIKNSIHKQKLSLKAVDIVLFGPPKSAHSYIKDLALILSLVVSVGGCWFAYSQYRYSQSHMKKMLRDLDSLQRAEDTLAELQNKLDLAEQSQRSVTMEKENLKQQFSDEISTAKKEASRLKSAREGTMEEMSRMKLAEEELQQVRSALLQAETQLENRPILSDLQQWLQLCHEMELKHYQSKRSSAERQLATVRDECTKMRKKRSTLVGSFRSTSIDDIDKKIASARSAFDEVRHDLQERQHRWATIEHICKFSIVQNPGLAYLCSLLQRDINTYGTVIVTAGMTTAVGQNIKAPSSFDSIDDDFGPLPPLKTVHHSDSAPNGQTWSSTTVKRSVSQSTNLSDSVIPVKFDLDSPSEPSILGETLNSSADDSISSIHSHNAFQSNGKVTISRKISAPSGPSHKLVPRSLTAIELGTSSASMDDIQNVVRSNTFSEGESGQRKIKRKKHILPSFRKKEKIN